MVGKQPVRRPAGASLFILGAGLLAVCVGLAGCPGAPVLTVNPGALDFGAG